jgi:hypothetical protein
LQRVAQQHGRTLEHHFLVLQARIAKTSMTTVHPIVIAGANAFSDEDIVYWTVTITVSLAVSPKHWATHDMALFQDGCFSQAFLSRCDTGPMQVLHDIALIPRLV